MSDSTVQYPRGLCCFALALAWSLGVGCSGKEIDQTSGVGGAPDISSGDVPPTPAVGTAVGSGGPHPGLVWIHRYGEAEDQTASALAVNEAGEIALVGTAKGTIDFGNIPWEGSTTDTDVVVATLSNEGHAQWSRRYGDSCDQHAGAVAHTPSGNVLVAGDFCGTMDFGKSAVTTKGSEVDLFVAVLDALGEDVYSRSFGGRGAQIARAAAVDSDGNAIVVGSFDQAFDDGTGRMPSVGLEDAFVLKLDPLGNPLWSIGLGGAEADVARSVAVDAKGNIVVGGSFGGTVDPGGGPLVAAAGHSNGFVVELDPAGKHMWSRSFGVDDAVVNGVAIGASGLLAVTGAFTGTIDFGNDPVVSAGEDDAFLATSDGAGQLVWRKTFGGPGMERGTSVTVAVNDDVGVSGVANEWFELGSPGIGGDGEHGPQALFFAYFNTDSSIVYGLALHSAGGLSSAGIGFSGTLGLTIAGSSTSRSSSIPSSRSPRADGTCSCSTSPDRGATSPPSGPDLS